VIRFLKLPRVLMLAGFLLLLMGNLFADPVLETNSTPRDSIPQRVRWHTIEIKPGPNSPKTHFYNKLNPVWWFKNSNDPVPPEWYRPHDRHRNLKWSFRNPMHNFNFYVIGVADKKFARSGRFPEKNSDPRGGWDFEAARYKFIWLPFISYHRPKFDFYFGWRNHGNFGVKINVNPNKKTEKEARPKDDDKISAPEE
jgi:hypothetical protein